MSLIETTRGNSPLVLCLPHTGTDIPNNCQVRLNDNGHAIADTDWHIHDLYADLVDNVSSVRTIVHRYVIDVNRDPSGKSLYPGQNTTRLCPTTDFDGLSIYLDGQAPDATEIERRRVAYHDPYHSVLAAELERVKAIHGFALLYDCHSIRSHIPFLFDGKLPDFSIGTNEGVTCAPELAASVLETCKKVQGYTSVLNGRFKGGWTTRHYGQPARGIHAIQMELAQSTYMIERARWNYVSEIAVQTRTHLKKIFQTLSNWRPQ